MRRFVFVLALLICLASPAHAERGYQQTLRAASTLATTDGLEVGTATFNPGHTRGYLVIITASEAATASLDVNVYGSYGSALRLICQLTAITTNTTTVALLGDAAAAASTGITDECDTPLPPTVTVTYEVTGAGASFTVSANMIWLAE